MGTEYAPDALEWLGDRMLEAIPGSEFSGIVGNPAHTYGYHRCRNKLPASDYSVKLAPDRAGDGWAASALDIRMPAAYMKTVTARLRASAEDPDDPRLEPIREFYGTLNGDIVFGRIHDSETGAWRTETADSTHLWHVHLGVFRKYANDKTKLAGVLSVITGEDNEMSWKTKLPMPGWVRDRWPDSWKAGSGEAEDILPSTYGHARSAKEMGYTNNTLIKTNHAAEMALLQQIAAGSSALTEEQIQAAVTRGVTAAMPDLDAVADAIGDRVDHDLDRAAVVAALREVFGSLGPGPDGE